jgi:Domain of unknown function (DUF4440)
MKRSVVVLTLLLVCTCSAYAQSSVEQEILKLVSERQTALEKDDYATHDRLTVPDPTQTIGNPPTLLTREMALNRRNLARKRGITMGSTVRSDQKVKVYGDTAIYYCSFKRVDKDKDGKEMTLEGRNTQTWVKLGGKWKLAASHSSPKIEMPK